MVSINEISTNFYSSLQNIKTQDLDTPNVNSNLDKNSLNVFISKFN